MLSEYPIQTLYHTPFYLQEGVVLVQIALRNPSMKQQTLSSLGQKSFIEKYVFFQSMTQVTEKKKIQVLSIGDEPMTFWLLVQVFNHLATGVCC